MSGAIAVELWFSEPWFEGCWWESDRPQKLRLSVSRFCAKVTSPETFLVERERVSTMAVFVGVERFGEMGGGDRQRAPSNIVPEVDGSQ